MIIVNIHTLLYNRYLYTYFYAKKLITKLLILSTTRKHYFSTLYRYLSCICNIDFDWLKTKLIKSHMYPREIRWQV